MNHTVTIRQSDSETLTLDSCHQIARQIVNTGASQVEIRVVDPRRLSNGQREKARALAGEISVWSGFEDPDYIYDRMKYDFCTQENVAWFSMRDCDMTTAHLYVTYLVHFCMRHSVPTKRPLHEFCDDLEAYVYHCLAYRKCAVHNKPKADIHHCTGSRVGTGRNRKKIAHVGLVCLPLCRECHNECHAGEVAFLDKHHLKGIALDEWLCQRLGMNVKVD